MDWGSAARRLITRPEAGQASEAQPRSDLVKDSWQARGSVLSGEQAGPAARDHQHADLVVSGPLHDLLWEVIQPAQFFHLKRLGTGRQVE